MPRPRRQTSKGIQSGLALRGQIQVRGVLIRRLGDREGKPGPEPGGISTRPPSEHIDTLIAALLNLNPNPEASLNYALATRDLRESEAARHQWKAAPSGTCGLWVL
jgi:hypothetical protein